MGVNWRGCRIDALTVRELDAIYRARQQVFVVEQACPYLDADGCDGDAFHLAAWAADNDLPVAYARVLSPGVKYLEPSIGRVLTAHVARGTGLGRQLIRRAIAHCDAVHPGAGIRISAQERLEAFYAEVGFIRVGAPYLEDDLPHIEMLRPSQAHV